MFISIKSLLSSFNVIDWCNYLKFEDKSQIKKIVWVSTEKKIYKYIHYTHNRIKCRRNFVVCGFQDTACNSNSFGACRLMYIFFSRSIFFSVILMRTTKLYFLELIEPNRLNLFSIVVNVYSCQSNHKSYKRSDFWKKDGLSRFKEKYYSNICNWFGFHKTTVSIGQITRQ